MSEWADDIKTYLPAYLSTDATEDLFREIKQFPSNIDGRMYTSRLAETSDLYQGDGFRNLPFINLPQEKIAPINVMVISNTCDIDPSNRRLMNVVRMMYCPILSLEKFIRAYKPGEEQIRNIRKQSISSIFYLPKGGGILEESIALLDRVVHFDRTVIDSETVKRDRLFTLSDYGFYMFLFKLSVHLTRIREGVARSNSTP